MMLATYFVFRQDRQSSYYLKSCKYIMFHTEHYPEMKHNTVVAEISQYHAITKRIAQNALELLNYRRN